MNPTGICYNSPGQYDVTLIATNTAGTDTLMLTNYITVYPYPPAQGILQNGDTLIANAGAVSYQWYHNSNMIPGATEYFYIATEGGNYNVVATDVNGCEVEAVIFDVIASTTPLSFGEGSGVRPFPNPVSETLSITGLSMIEIPKKISIYNALGEFVLSVQLQTANRPDNLQEQSYSVDVSEIANGIYWLNIETADQIRRFKFFKQ
jgi:PKD repeat protein